MNAGLKPLRERKRQPVPPEEACQPLHADAALFKAGPRLPLPLAAGFVRAGFPSPADDFTVKRHDLNELLITDPDSQNLTVEK